MEKVSVGSGVERVQAVALGADWGGKEVQARLTNHSAQRLQYLVTALLIISLPARNARIMPTLHILFRKQD